ncbi:MAG: terminase small subunit [Candidatus Peribacteraceae bacterium]|nr:terminase small subunit [Candidatus Peribacteraceae bacterium]
MPKGERLSPQQELFIEEYLTDFNATQAAIRSGYSERSARVTGTTLLAIPAIRAIVEERRAEAILKVRKDRAKFLNHLKSRLYLDMGELAEWNGGSVKLKDSKTLNVRHRRMIKTIASGEHGPKLTLKEDNKAMDILAKHFGFTKEELLHPPSDFFDDVDEGDGQLTDEELALRYSKIVGVK